MNSKSKKVSDLGTLYMMPCPIVEDEFSSIPKKTIVQIHKTIHFVVERTRTARRFLRAIGHPIPIDDMSFFELDKNNPLVGLHVFLERLKTGTDVGVLSEAGCPGIADPGNLAVQYAHQHNITVVPLVGPSSILLALIASGLNGQNFAFNGYLPNKAPELVNKLKRLEGVLHKFKQTQIFMEAPYRNEFILENCVKALSQNIRLCIACDIDSENEFIKTQTIKNWKGTNFMVFHKRPTVFLIGI